MLDYHDNSEFDNLRTPLTVLSNDGFICLTKVLVCENHKTHSSKPKTCPFNHVTHNTLGIIAIVTKHPRLATGLFALVYV